MRLHLPLLIPRGLLLRVIYFLLLLLIVVWRKLLLIIAYLKARITQPWKVLKSILILAQVTHRCCVLFEMLILLKAEDMARFHLSLKGDSLRLLLWSYF